MQARVWTLSIPEIMAVGQRGVKQCRGRKEEQHHRAYSDGGEQRVEGGLFVLERMKWSSLRIVRTQIKRFDKPVTRLRSNNTFQTHENIPSCLATFGEEERERMIKKKMKKNREEKKIGEGGKKKKKRNRNENGGGKKNGSPFMLSISKRYGNTLQ